MPAPASPGSLDLTFDPTRGGQLVGPAISSGELVTLARQPDGKLLLAGQFSGYNGHLRRHILRIQPNGQIDDSFNPGFGADNWIFAVVTQPDGKILIGGFFSIFDTQPRSLVARLNPDGTLDPDFLPVAPSGAYQSCVRAMALQPDGKILIAGYFSRVNGFSRPGVARLNPDGSLDSTFNFPDETLSEFYDVSSLWLLPDGKLLVGGRFLDRRCLLHRLNPDGSPDPSFASELTGYDLSGFAVRSDGKIYAAGYFDLGEPGWNYHQVVLLNADGTIEPGFTVDFGEPRYFKVLALAVEPDDRLVIGGFFQSVNGFARTNLARLYPDGTTDETFDPGPALHGWYAGNFTPAMLREPDGHLWLGGQGYLSNGVPTALLRLEPNGPLDHAFYEQAGQLEIPGDMTFIEVLEPCSAGRAYVGGIFDSFNNQPRAGLARILPDGSLDSTFCPMWTNRMEVQLLVQQPDGRLLVGGHLRDSPYHTAMVRLCPDGRLDSSFITPGDASFGRPFWNMRIHCFALQSDGKIVTGGEFEDGLARLNSDGSFDDSFQPPYLPAYDGDAVHALAIQPDGKIVFGGTQLIGLHRLNADGTLDPTFNFDGQIGSPVKHIIVLPGGSILIAGPSCVLLGAEQLGLVRLRSNGRIDLTFNPPVGPTVDTLTVEPDGHILVAAEQNGGTQPARIYRLDTKGNLDPCFQTQVGVSFREKSVGDILLQPDGQVLLGGTFTSVNGLPLDGLARLHGSPTPWALRSLPSVCTPSRVTVEITARPASNVTVYAVEDQPPAAWPVVSISEGGSFDATSGKVKFGPFYDSDARSLRYEVVPPVWGVHCSSGVYSFNGVASADGISSLIQGDSSLALAGYFPADVNPPDRHISIDEMTTYGAAWRNGSNWLCHPLGIPIHYATRAATLWRLGECYSVNSLIATEPLWWVPCAADGSGFSAPQTNQAKLDELSFAERRAPAVFIPGQPLTITLEVSPAPGTMAYAAEDQIPPGWTIAKVTHAGQFDSRNTKIKWGPFHDAQPRSLCYQAMPPANAAAVVTLAGTASFDGSSLRVSGSNVLAASSKILVGLQPATGRLFMTLLGPIGTRYQVETSTNLARWLSLGEITAGPDPVLLPVSGSPTEPQRFYRARRLD